MRNQAHVKKMMIFYLHIFIQFKWIFSSQANTLFIFKSLAENFV